MYDQEITRTHRTAFVIAVDQSGSMQESILFAGHHVAKAQAVAVIVGAMIDELVMRSRFCDEHRNYYDVAVIGYSNTSVYSLLDFEGFVPVTMLAQCQVPQVELRFDDEPSAEGPASLTYSEWIKPRAEGETPMYETLATIYDMVGRWCNEPQNRDSFPPMVFNITDGEASDCDEASLLRMAERLRATSTRNGSTLLVNTHLSSDPKAKALLFPNPSEVPHGVDKVNLLEQMSSLLPEPFNAAVESVRLTPSTPPYLAMAYNASAADAFSIINIGSYSATYIR
ncbi:MAG: VWA domain-containing protein [Alistipes sp.]|jgi:hypothetical protein|nr:VWA domain-containing protein [Alistipes sp.]